MCSLEAQTKKGRIKRFFKEHRDIGLVLLFAFLYGLVFVFVIPPWQHYDEPGNFEYAWLIAHRDAQPQYGEFDQGMRREVAASMLETHFFDKLNFQPTLVTLSDPVWIGISQFADPPLYYQLVSLPLRVLAYADVRTQLIAARLVSLLLYLVIILAAWGLVGEITPPRHLLRILVPLTLIIIPGVTDMMTAVNNDVGATASFSLFLWSGVRLLRRKHTLRTYLATAAVMAALAYLSASMKNTAYLAVPLAVFIVLISLIPRRWRWTLWVGLGIAGLAALVVSFTVDNAANWLSDRPQASADRAYRTEAPKGKYALQIDAPAGESSSRLYQIIPPSQIPAITGKTLTLGVWIWASRPVIIRAPYLATAEKGDIDSGPVAIGTQPAFYSFQISLPKETTRAWVNLYPLPAGVDTSVIIYYDGLALAPGAWSPNKKPHFDDATSQSGIWASQPFTNLIRNASAENAWPRLRQGIDQRGAGIFPAQPSQIISSLLDWRGTGFYYPTAIQYLFTTFWAKFGWGNVPLEGSLSYPVLEAATILALLGLVWAAANAWIARRKDPANTMPFPWGSALVLAIVVVSIWSITLLRGVPNLTGRLFFPPARYAFPAVIPTVLLLVIGWYQIGVQLARWLQLKGEYLFMVYCAAFSGLNVLALYSLFTNFYWR